ncbi:hypothetical protein PQC06_gp082 [Aeromonas phage LAh10]|uniref:Uncharacterized protein n=1 Tax=Aeromonas phage LAh10 TaxID=2591025 RepID=A0A514A1J5_9CAUD|nr:hypothetical protein PQC06_gp082 [Aeromonas phage LAh10]QDH47102.1 hypothetical protein LAh10_82 [Aeromonas phage LAh10]
MKTLPNEFLKVNPIASQVIPLYFEDAWNMNSQGSWKINGRHDDVGYDVEIVHALGSVIVRGTFGHNVGVITMPRNSMAKMAIGESMVQAVGNLDNSRLCSEANPQSKDKILALFDGAFSRAKREVNYLKASNAGNKGADLMRQAEFIGLGAILTRLIANRKISMGDFEVLTMSGWEIDFDRMTEINEGKVGLFDAPAIILRSTAKVDIHVTLKATGTIIVSLIEQVEGEVIHRTTLPMGVCDQITGTHSSLNENCTSMFVELSKYILGGKNRS